MPPVHSSAQKSAITQFQNFTQADKNTAVRYLKTHGWNQDAAINGYFSGGGGAAVPLGMTSALNKLFDKYQENAANSPDTVGMEGTSSYLADIGVSLEGLEFLAVSQIIQAPGIGEMSRKEFVEGWSKLNCDTLDKQKHYVHHLKQTLPSDKEAFSRIYIYTFLFSKSGNQKTLPLEHACAYWELLFTSPMSAVKWTTSSSPWIKWWLEFLESEWKRAINKDHWVQTLKFAQMTLQDESLSFWTEESSWPSIIDEFVEWVKKEKRGGGTGEAMEE